MEISCLSIDEYSLIAKFLSFIDRLHFFQFLWKEKLISCDGMIQTFELFNIFDMP